MNHLPVTFNHCLHTSRQYVTFFFANLKLYLIQIKTIEQNISPCSIAKGNRQCRRKQRVIEMSKKMSKETESHRKYSYYSYQYYSILIIVIILSIKVLVLILNIFLTFSKVMKISFLVLSNVVLGCTDTDDIFPGKIKEG